MAEQQAFMVSPLKVHDRSPPTAECTVGVRVRVCGTCPDEPPRGPNRADRAQVLRQVVRHFVAAFLPPEACLI